MRDGLLSLELKGSLPPRNEGPPLHIHQVEIEEGVVIAGTLGAMLNGQRLRLTAGQRVQFPAGAPHRWWNDGDDTLQDSNRGFSRHQRTDSWLFSS